MRLEWKVSLFSVFDVAGEKTLTKNIVKNFRFH